jgi:peptide-methionine (R)-S-oxide reductase
MRQRASATLLIIVPILLAACARPDAPGRGTDLAGKTEKTVKSDEEWRKTLTAEEYGILREKGTERAFTGKYWATKTPGTYLCAGCGTPLFRSDAKFDSGCGWPSFFEALEAFAVEESEDFSYGMRRTEVTCRSCGGHLGHVFDDGPPPTGRRYCINSVSIRLVPDGPGAPK